jgi:hypothetical protein
MSATVKVLIFAVFVLGLLVSGFSLGYHWKGYDDTQSAVNDLKQVARDQYNRVDEMLKKNKGLVDHIDGLNKATAEDQAKTAKLLEDQNHAMQILAAKLRDQSFGTCAFTVGADGLFLDAYRAVYPAAGATQAASDHQAPH